MLRDAEAFAEAINRLEEKYRDLDFETIVAVESRGFVFGAPLAYKMGKGFVPVRKAGKLPGATHSAEYSLEYGTNEMEIHVGDISQGERVLILDDLLATGGTLEATIELVEVSGGAVAGIGLVIELSGLGGRERLAEYDIFSLVQY